MSQAQKDVYKKLYFGLKELSGGIRFHSALPPSVIQDVYFKMLYDTPLFYFVNPTSVQMSRAETEYTVAPGYLYSARETEALNRDIRRVVYKVVSQTGRFRGNPFRIEKYLHDSVVKSVAYDYDSLKRSGSHHAHSVVGAFIDNKAVCDGISKAFKLLCNEASIKCIVVVGKADRTGIFGEDSHHAWNLVKIGGNSYHVDATWDNFFDQGIAHISYDYFNVKTEDILKDHHIFDSLPFCDAIQLNYFYSTKSIVSTYAELIDLITERFNAKAIMFKTGTERGEFFSSDELQKKAMSAVSFVMNKKLQQREYAFLVNPSQMTGKIIFFQ